MVSWFNPRTSQATHIGEFTKKNGHTFKPSGDGGWVLVADQRTNEMEKLLSP